MDRYVDSSPRNALKLVYMQQHATFKKNFACGGLSSKQQLTPTWKNSCGRSWLSMWAFCACKLVQTLHSIMLSPAILWTML